jgi:hypothetical protein
MQTTGQETAMTALLIPVEGPVVEVELDGTLEQLQALVGGGCIQAVPIPEFADRTGQSTGYVNDEGKFRADLEPNMRATDFMVPGVGLLYGDYVAGPFLLCGFDPETGDQAELPPTVRARARHIEAEAA